MRLLYALFFGAGVTGFAYNKFVRRVGYSNTQSVLVLTGIIFVLSAAVFYTILAFILNVQ
jgi:hypothetical protein